MALRYCVFKDCHNSSKVDYKCYAKDGLTFFQFPKDPQRRQKWMELGKVKPNLPVSYYYFCSDHFDRKYKAKNDRRTSLIGDALPYPHESLIPRQQPDELCYDEEYVTDEIPDDLFPYEAVNNDFNTASQDDAMQEQHLQVESTTFTNENILEVVRKEISSDEHMELTIASMTGESVTKLKTLNTSSPNLFSWRNEKKLKLTKDLQLLPAGKTNTVIGKKLQLFSTYADDNKSNRAEDTLNNADHRSDNAFISKTHNITDLEDQHIDPNTLVDSSSVTVFIYKGEEYVQMPKDYYVKEKMALINKLNKMESIIKNIKHECNRI